MTSTACSKGWPGNAGGLDIAHGKGRCNAEGHAGLMGVAELFPKLILTAGVFS